MQMNERQNTSDVIEAPDLVLRTASGRATWDERGNASWEWQTQPGVFTRDISSHELSRLEATQLRVLDASPKKNFDGLWIHESDRREPRYQAAPSQAARERAGKRSGFESFIRRLGFSARN